MLSVVKQTVNMLSVVMLIVVGSKDDDVILFWVFDNIKKFQYKKVKTKAALTRANISSQKRWRRP